MWKVIKEKTEDHWLEIEDPEGWYSAVVKWDGCIHFYRHHNEPIPNTDESDIDYIHICGVNDFIKRLQALKEEAIKHFGKDWGGQ